MKRVISIFKQENGEAIVESAMVFPLVILAIITIIYICAYMYDEVNSTTRTELAARKLAGEDMDSFYTSRNSFDGVKTALGGGSTKKSFATKGISIEKRGLLETSFSKNISSRCYVIDEKSEIRIYDFIFGNKE